MLLAEAIIERVPSVELVRFVSSGTEATMTAIRVARGFTGRPTRREVRRQLPRPRRLLLAAGGSGVAALGLPGSDGVTEGAVARHARRAVQRRARNSTTTTACVIVEPIAANMGLVAPVPGFLQGLRDECDRVGALLVFDEVITGFRVGRGGAQARFGVRPDLTCFGKVIGGGLPVGAYGGRARVMACVAPLGPVYQAGTLSGNPLAMAAGLAALELLDDDAYATLAGHRAPVSPTDWPRRSMPAGVAARGAGRGHAGRRCTSAPTLPTDYAGARTTDERGVRAVLPRAPRRRRGDRARARTRCCSRDSPTMDRFSTRSSSAAGRVRQQRST